MLAKTEGVGEGVCVCVCVRKREKEWKKSRANGKVYRE